MVVFREMGLWDRLHLALSPSYKARRFAETKAAIRHLIDHPEEPCMIGSALIPNGMANTGGQYQNPAPWLSGPIQNYGGEMHGVDESWPWLGGY